MKIPSRRFSFEQEIKRSRFIAWVAHVERMPDTLDFYESVADPAATHNCWAWKLGHQYRFNDDGEPASTAGKPILAAIEGKGLDHTMVVVTRYYGGTKLGVGGLVRAYGGTASRCIDQAGITDLRPRCRCLIQAGFNWTGQVYAQLDLLGASRENERFNSDGVEMEVELEVAAFEKLKSALRDATRGEARIRLLE